MFREKESRGDRSWRGAFYKEGPTGEWGSRARKRIRQRGLSADLQRICTDGAFPQIPGGEVVWRSRWWRNNARTQKGSSRSPDSSGAKTSENSPEERSKSCHSGG